MIGQPITRDVDIASSNTDMTRDGQVHQRVYDPESTDILKQILVEMRSMNRHLEIITELEVNDWD
jgi:hypothetical protein